MMRKAADKNTLDSIGKRIVLAASERPADIERVVNDPLLFTRVRAKIAEIESADTRHVTFIDRWTGFTSRHGAAFAGVAAVLLVSVAFIAGRLVSPETPVVPTVTFTSEPDTALDTAAPIAFPPAREPSRRPAPERAVTTEEPQIERSVMRTSVPAPARTKKAPVERGAGQFYAVSENGGLQENGGRIVRVELSRSALFAMGVNVPLENDGGTVKADLLIGRDGTTRGIRFVDEQ